MSTSHCQFVPRKLGTEGADLVLLSRDKTREQASEFLIEVTAPRVLEDQLIQVWWEFGYSGAVEEDAGENVRWKVFFEPNTRPETLHLCAARCAAVDPMVTAHVQSQLVADWTEQWKLFFHPVEISPELVITTEDIPHTPRSGQKPIVIKAGMAFGTGQHPTTQLIARAIAADFPARRWDRLLDVGTGTGILGLVALGCGVKHVDGMDIDPDALICAEENVSKNNMLDMFSLHDTLSTILAPYPCVVANILRDPLVEMAPTLCALLGAGGDIYLSGILIDQVDTLNAAYEGQGLRHVRTDTQDEWAMLHLRST